MGCCIAVALIIALVRTAWFRLFRGGEPARTGFAPPAVRRFGAVAPTAGPPTAPEAGRTLVPTALAMLTGAGLYAELLAVLARTGAVLVDTGTPVWRIREAALIVAGIAAAVAALALRARWAAQRDRLVGVTLLAAGGAWAVVSVLDMHVTGLVPGHHVSPLADLALHGPGFLALTVGALLVGARRLPTYTGATS